MRSPRTATREEPLLTATRVAKKTSREEAQTREGEGKHQWRQEEKQQRTMEAVGRKPSREQGDPCHGVEDATATGAWVSVGAVEMLRES